MANEEAQSVGGDMVGGDKIVVGDVQGSVAAIGAGAKVIYNNVERALSQVEVFEQAEEVEMQRLAESVKGYVARLQAQVEQTKEVPEGGTPYKALLSYDFQDAALFYGRSSVIANVLGLLERSPLTVLHADSGAGKTSLIKAGLMPRLLANGDVPVFVRPYQRWVHFAVKSAIMPRLETSPSLGVASLHDFLQLVTNLLGDRRLVIFLDQFEEVFTGQSKNMRNDFLAEFGPCLEDSLLPVRWVISLRGEWFTQLGTLRPQVRDPYSNEHLLKKLTADEAREAIVEPAKRYGVTYEDVLLNRLLEDLKETHGSDEIEPPQMQLVCSALYDSRNGSDRISAALYDELGGTEGILRSHLDRVLSQNVPPDQRIAARHLLEALVSSDRRRVRRGSSELARELQVLGVDENTLSEVLEVLVASHLLHTEAISEESREVGYELAHDYIVNEIEVDPGTRMRKAAKELLEQKIPYYERDGLLLSAEELDIVQPHEDELVLNPQETKLLRESITRANRQRRTRIALIAAAVALIVGLSLAFGLYQQRLAAQASSRELAAQVDLSLQHGDVITAYGQAEAAHEAASTVESWGALYAVLSHALPVRSFGGHGDWVRRGEFSPDGTRLVTASHDDQARVFDLETGELLLTLAGHTADVTTAEFSPDGTQILTGSFDGTLRLWDAETGDLIDILRGHGDGVFTAFYSPDGSRIVSASRDASIRVWDAQTGIEELTIAGRTETATPDDLTDYGHENWVRWAEFSHDSSKIVSGGRDTTARIWDAETGDQLCVLIGHSNWVNGVTFSPDDSQVVSASGDGTIRLWDAETCQPLSSAIDALAGALFTVAYSPDGQHLLVAAGDNTARILSGDGQPEVTLRGHTDEVLGAAYSAHGQQVVTASKDRQVLLWDLSRRAPLPTLEGHRAAVNTAFYSHDGQLIVTASQDNTAIIWDALTGDARRVLTGHTDFVNVASFNQDDTRILTADNRTARLWDVETGEELQQLPAGAGDITWAALSPDGTQALVVSTGPLANVWDIDRGEVLFTLPGHMSPIVMGAYSPDGARIVTSTTAGNSYLWDAASGEEIAPMLGQTGRVNWAEFSADSAWVVTASADGTAWVWDGRSGDLYRVLDLPEADDPSPVAMATFNPADPAEVLTVSGDKIGRIWNTGDGSVAHTLAGPTDPLSWGAYNADGSLIVTGGSQGSVWLWDAPRGRVIARLEGHTGAINTAMFSPDGAWIVTSSEDNTARLWRTDLEALPAMVAEQLAPLE